jgi:hypothetical protein
MTKRYVTKTKDKEMLHSNTKINKRKIIKRISNLPRLTTHLQ